MENSTASDSYIGVGGKADLPPSRRVQMVELGVFLLLIVPPMATSFMINNQGGPGFITGAVLAILSDLGLVSLVFYFVWRNGELPRRIGWTNENLLWEAGLGLLLFFPVMFGTNLLEAALHQAGLSLPAKRPSFLVATGDTGVVMALLLVIVVAVVEETLFRGYLILRLKTAVRRSWAAVLLSSAVFAVGHGYEGMAGVISVFVLGMVLGMIYLWRSSLMAPMIIHFLIDFSSIVVVALMNIQR